MRSPCLCPPAGGRHGPSPPAPLQPGPAPTGHSGPRTWDWALMLAPSLTRTLTTSACPAREAMWRAVFPFCLEKRERKRYWFPDFAEIDLYRHVPCGWLLQVGRPCRSVKAAAGRGEGRFTVQTRTPPPRLCPLCARPEPREGQTD